MRVIPSRTADRRRVPADLANATSSLLIACLAVVVWRNAWWTTDAPPWYLVLTAVALLALGASRASGLGWGWWIWGAASIGWSLTPGTTLATSLWGLVFLAALGARSLAVVTATLALLVLDGLFSIVSLELVGIHQLFSGSINYTTGAVAVALVPVSVAAAVRADSILRRAVWAVLAAVATVAVMAAGARAVYIPFMTSLPLVAWRLRSAHHARHRLVVLTLFLAAMVVTFDVSVPGHPITTAVRVKANRTLASLAAAGAGEPAQDQEGAPTAGSFRSRLLMWKQAVLIGLTHPMGTGLGSFRETVQAFQRFPTINFASAHNFVVETFATLGWPGLAILLALVLARLWRGWADTDLWPFAIGAGALWTTMLFDITWSLPSVALIAFILLGTLAPRRNGEKPVFQPILRWALVAVAAGVAVHWYAPCVSSTCALDRHLGYRPEATALLRGATPPRRLSYLDRLDRLYPKSLWVRTLRRSTSETDAERLAVDQSIAADFPLASPDVYLDWARLAVSMGDTDQARLALQTGLRNFPSGAAPAGVPLRSASSQYATWISAATTMLGQLP